MQVPFEDEETMWRCKQLREIFRLFDLDDSHVITGDEVSLPIKLSLWRLILLISRSWHSG